LSPELRETFVDSEAADQSRTVQYFDKGRMEINGDLNVVTRGLLPVEMIQGHIQIGYVALQEYPAADIPAVGDPDNDFPTYADLQGVYASPGNVDTERIGQPVLSLLNPDGSISNSFDTFAQDPGTVLQLGLNNHGVPQAFLDFQNQTGTVYVNDSYTTAPIYANALEVFGLPVTEPYWVNVVVDDQPTYILFQVFERRVLTYNPLNPPRFRVEMGNVGRHFYQWKYGENPPTPPVNQPLPLEGSPLPEATATVPPIDTTTVPPVDTTTVPPVDTTTVPPVGTTPVPTTPTAETTTPTAEATTPTAEATTPTAEATTPTAEATTPTAEATTPTIPITPEPDPDETTTSIPITPEPEEPATPEPGD
jgi:hypothetical protein